MNNEILNAALQYAANGWAVFPVSKEKNPLTPNGFRDASKDPKIIKSWYKKYTGANVAIATGQVSGGLVVIDIDYDEEKGIDGFASFREWEEENGCKISSRSATTGRQGCHIYFTTKEPIGCKVNALDGVDIRGDGGYIIAPPSIHKNGREYFWDDEDEEIECVQDDSDVDFFFAEAFRNAPSSGPFSAPAQATAGSRNDTIFKMAAAFQSKGLDDDAIMIACKAYNQKNCNPPLPDDELERTVKSALRYDKGVKEAPKPTAEDIKSEERKTENVKKLQKLRKANDLLKENVPELNVIVGIDNELPFLVEGTCILSAKSKLGKSWLALELCDAVSKGVDFLGYKTKKCSALYLDLETKKPLKIKRLQRLTDAVGELSDNYSIQDTAYMMGEGFEEEIANYLEQDPEIRVIVIDVFQKILKPKRKDLSEYEYFYDKIGTLNKISEKYHLSIILVCHDRKTVDPGDPFSNILGSTALQGATDQMIVMYKNRFNDPVTHIAVKGRTIDGIIEMDAQILNGLWVKAENASAVRKMDELKKSPIFEGVKKILDMESTWEGRCSEFYAKCTKMGIDLELPKDKNNNIDFRPIGAAFQSQEFEDLMTEYDIKFKQIKNGSGARYYKFTVDTVDEFKTTVDENPFEA